MLFPKSQVEMIVNGEKVATLRKPTYNIIVGKEHKFVNNFKYGAFASAYITSAELISVDDITDELAHYLGYFNREEYLANGWNDEFDRRLLISWSNISVNWDAVDKILNR